MAEIKSKLSTGKNLLGELDKPHDYAPVFADLSKVESTIPEAQRQPAADYLGTVPDAMKDAERAAIANQAFLADVFQAAYPPDVVADNLHAFRDAYATKQKWIKDGENIDDATFYAKAGEMFRQHGEFSKLAGEVMGKVQAAAMGGDTQLRGVMTQALAEARGKPGYPNSPEQLDALRLATDSIAQKIASSEKYKNAIEAVKAAWQATQQFSGEDGDAGGRDLGARGNALDTLSTVPDEDVPMVLALAAQKIKAGEAGAGRELSAPEKLMARAGESIANMFSSAWQNREKAAYDDMAPEEQKAYMSRLRSEHLLDQMLTGQPGQLKAESWLGEQAMAMLSELPKTFAAATPVGAAVFYMDARNRTQNRLMFEHGYTPEQATATAPYIAGIETLANQWQSKFLLENPAGKAVIKWSGDSLLKRFVLTAATEAAGVGGIMATQAASDPIIRKIASVMDEDLPGVNFKEEAARFAGMALEPEVWAQLSMMALLGTGMAHFSHPAYYNHVQNEALLKAMGVKAGDVKKVMTLPPEEAVGQIADILARRGPPDAAAVEQLNVEARAERAKLEGYKATFSPQADGSHTWNVTLPDGRVIGPFGSPEMAGEAIRGEKARLSSPPEQPLKYAFTTSTEKIGAMGRLIADRNAEQVARVTEMAVKHAFADMPDVKVTIEHGTGLWEGSREQSAGITVIAPTVDRLEQARARMATLGEQWNQDAIYEMGVGMGDPSKLYRGSEDSNGYHHNERITIHASGLTPEIVEQARKAAGLPALTEFPDRIETINVSFNGKPDTTFGEKVRAFADALTDAGADVRAVDLDTVAIRGYAADQAAYPGTRSYRSEEILAANKRNPQGELRFPLARTLFEEMGAVPKPPANRSWHTKAEMTPEHVEEQKGVARHFAERPINDLANPDVQQAYARAAEVIGQQWDYLVKAGMRFTAHDWGEKGGEPYANSAEAVHDIRANGALRILKTDPTTFGPAGSDFSNHPFLKDSGRTDANGRALNYNDLLRGVHDAIAHGLFADTFGPVGEQGAWAAHMRTISDPWARWAITTETRGQNSWVNYNERVLGEHGLPALPGEPGHVAIKDRPFAAQKAMLLPLSDVLTGDAEVDAPVRALSEEIGPDRAEGSKPVGEGIVSTAANDALSAFSGDKAKALKSLLDERAKTGNKKLDSAIRELAGDSDVPVEEAKPYTKEALAESFNLTPAQADAVDAIIKVAKLDTEKLKIGKRGGAEDVLALSQIRRPKKPLDGSLGEGDLRFVHYSGTSGIEVLNPELLGKSGITPPSERRGLNRSYGFTRGSFEDVGNRPHKYEGSVPKGLIYDGYTDKFGYNDMINREKADQMLVDKGFIGIWRRARGGKVRQVEFFDPVKVWQLYQESSAFHSRLTRTIEASPQGKATGAQWKATLRNKGVASDEWALVGVDDLEDGKTYTKQEVLDFLNENRVEVHEDALGNTIKKKQQPNGKWTVGEHRDLTFDKADQLEAESAKDVHFSSYTLPGEKEQYGETHLTAPGVNRSSARDEAEARFVEKYGKVWTVADLNHAEHDEFLALVKEKVGSNWRDGHDAYSNILNPIVRIRHSVRTLADGKRVLFLDEIQPPNAANFEKMPKLFQDRWREIGMKWAVKKAADEGLDGVAWTTGEQQAERYDLSKQVDEIAWAKNDDGTIGVSALRDNGEVIGEYDNKTPAELEGIIGKEMVRRITESPEKKDSFTGQDLKVGGEGLRKLYDRDLVNIANKLGKKLGVVAQPEGASVEAVNRGSGWELFKGGELVANGDDAAAARWRAQGKASGEYEIRPAADRPEANAIHILPLSDSARATISEQGFPLAQGAKGSATMGPNGQATIRGLNNPDFSTGWHEVGHSIRNQFFNRANPLPEGSPLTEADRDIVDNFVGATKDAPWSRESDEKFARAWEQYGAEGKAPTPELQGVFDKVKAWLLEIYQKIAGSDIDAGLTPEMRAVFDKMLGGTPETRAAAEAAATTGTSRAKVNEALKARGMEELSASDYESQKDTLAKAAAVLSKEPGAARRLVDEIEAGKAAGKPRMLDATERAILGMEARRAENARTETAIRKAELTAQEATPETRDELAKLREQEQAQQAEFERLTEASRAAGEDTARALAAQNMMLRDDYTLAAVTLRIKEALGERPITPEQEKAVEALTAKIRELEGRMANVEMAGRAKAKTARSGKSLSDRAAEARARIADRATPLYQEAKKDQTDTPEFKAWFGDYSAPYIYSSRRAADAPPASTVVERVNGEIKPKVVYHGTEGGHSTFETGRPTENSMGFFGNYTTQRHAIFFSDNKAQAKSYAPENGGRVVDAYLSIKSPLRIDVNTDWEGLAQETGISYRWLTTKEHTWELFDGEDGKVFVEALKKAGYDGVEFQESALPGHEETGTTYAVFDSSQIKSATGNRGTFDPNDPNILHQLPPEWADHAIVGAEKIASGMTDYNAWAASMRSEFGDAIEPHLKDIHEAARLEAGAEADGVAARVARLRQRIENAKAKLASGQPEPEKRAVNRPQPEALEKALQELEAVNAELRAARGDSAREARLRQRLADIEGSMADVKATGEAPEPEAASEKPESPRALALRSEIEIAKAQLDGLVEAARVKAMTPAQRVRYEALNAWDSARTIITGLELSFIGRQALVPVASHPLRAAKALPDMFRALVANPTRAHEINLQTLSDPVAEQALADGLFLADDTNTALTRQQEFAMGKMVGRIPLVRNFNQAGIIFLNRIALDLYKGMATGLPEAERKQLVKYANSAVGRGALGPLENHAVLLNRLMFSARFNLSRLQILAGTSLWGGNARTRGIIAKEYLRAAMGLSSALAAVYAIEGGFDDDKDKNDATMSFNPLSSNFLKVKTGDVRRDLLGGFGQWMVYASRTAAAASAAAKREVGATPTSAEKYEAMRWMETTQRFIMGRAHPLVGVTARVMTGKKQEGEVPTLRREAMMLLVPMTYADIYEAAKSEGMSADEIDAFMALIGMGLQTYHEDNPPRTRR